MKRLRRLKRQMFDIRPGEHLRTWAMFSYLLFVLFAYYIVKPVSRAMFLTKFDIDKLPGLYILIAIFGGILAYFYSKLAARTSLRTAVFWAMSLSVLSLVAMWWMIRMRLPWMLYVLNIWVSLFSIVSVSQGWLVASNIFNTREAKRLYPLLGMGMVLGAAFGGEFTNRTVLWVGTNNLLLASAVMVVLAYVSFRVAIRQTSAAVEHAKAAGEEQSDFSFPQMMRDIGLSRHLQIIVGMMVVMYLVDTLVEYQFQAMAASGYHGDHLTAFFGQFYGIYLNGVEILFQLFLTATVVHWFGVGGTLHIAPIAVALSSISTIVAPGVWSASAVRLTEASTRYTLNKTGMELLYMPLPLELRNRIKAFIDICVDRLSRGLGGVLLILLTRKWLHLDVKGLAFVVAGLCIPWMLFSHLARREYVSSIRKRLAARRFDFTESRITVTDPDTLRLLEGAADTGNPRQAAYALDLLSEAPAYDVRPLLQKLIRDRREPEVRLKIYEIAARLQFEGVIDEAMLDARRDIPEADPQIVAAAVQYAVQVAHDRLSLAAEWLDNPGTPQARGVLEALRSAPEEARRIITRAWLDRATASPDPERRALAALAVGVRGDQGVETLNRLFDDADPSVIAAACRTAGLLRNREYLFPVIRALGHPRLRGDAIAALAAYGPSIAGSLSDVLLDESAPAAVRRHVPRVLRGIPHQRSVDVLLSAVGCRDLTIRAAVLKALNRLRESSPQLNFENTFVSEQILKEARHYVELNAALAPFRERKDGLAATRLLARTIEDRLRATLARLFRLLGLRYPPKEIYSAYLAVSGQRHEEMSAAVEFLDNVMERDLKKMLLPLLEAPEHVLEQGRDLYGVKVPTAEEAIRDLIHSHDPWLVACAVASAAELKLRSLAPEIAQAAQESEQDVSEVARSAEAALAA